MRLLRPEIRDMATPVSGCKWVQSMKHDIVNGYSAIYVRWLLDGGYVSLLHSADES